MAQKRYKMVVAAQAGFWVSGTQYQFKTTYSRIEADTTKTIIPASLAPLITVPVVATAVLGTTSADVQTCLDGQLCPSGLQPSPVPPTGQMWVDVTSTTIPGDVTLDLDTILT